MKRYLYIILSALPFMAMSQNMYNITGLLDNAPAGTARFVGMGGSMGALGADVSVIGVNPAGTAVYRSTDFSLTGNADYVENQAKRGSHAERTKYSGASFNNFGFVAALETKLSSLKFLNIGFSYNKRASSTGNFRAVADAEGYSQQYVIQKLYDDNAFDMNGITSSMFQEFSANWLAMLAVKGGLFDDKAELLYIPERYEYYSELRGGVNDINFNLSANLNDRIYLGATVGCYFADYSRYSLFYEVDNEGDKYSLENNYRLEGKGVDFKLGAIFRPFEYSPFKVGLAVHTPIFYDLVDVSSANIEGPEFNMYDTREKSAYGDNLYSGYSLTTPWRINASMAYTIGGSVALNAEYEFADASSTSFSQVSEVGKAQNEEIRYNLRPQHTVRVGAEFFIKNCALRAGYNYISAPFNKTAYKNMDNATIAETSTEFMNSYGKNIATFGIGYAGKYFYADAAYMVQMQKSDFYPYLDYYYDDNDSYYENRPVEVNTIKHSIMATIGVRF
ncbi:MAG: hypothetical protein IJY44_05465 [Bacteroidaceae bacterium]|nr:hypothetical protein [Bacteroidaceae bacterium]